jgi:membrane-bound lytic murein transglycosylase A
MSRVVCVALVAIAALLSPGCVKKKPPVASPIDFSTELPPGQLALRKIPPAEYPVFSLAQGNRDDLIKSIDNSLRYLGRASSRNYFPYLDVTHDRAVASLAALRELVASASQGISDEELSRRIAEKFEVYQSIGAPDPAGAGYTSRVLFTAYCTPIYDASPTRTAQFQYPLYAKPNDLVADPIAGQVFGRRTPDGTLVPYYTRKEIEEGGVLAGNEIVWLKSRWDAYVITIQGSARLRMPDGSTLEIGYAGANGLEYKSPGLKLLEDGKIRKDQLNLRGLAAYFAANPQDLGPYTTINDRYVFFAQTSGGPFGSLGVPVTPFATIATDKAVYPRAMPAFLVTPMAGNNGTTMNYRGFMLDQDTGGAIRAAGRTDIYMGIGPEAEARSGLQLHDGQLYYVAVKPKLVTQYLDAVDLGKDDH